MISPWSLRPLGELVEVLDHKRVPVSAAERAKRPGTVPYYGAAGQVGTIDRSLFDEPLLLLGEDGVQFFDREKPKAYLVDGPSWVNNHAHVLRAKAHADRRWLLHYLNAFDYDGYANGTTRLKLTKSSMTAIPVPVPPLDEQHRIVAVLEEHLSRLDAAEAYLRASGRRYVALLQSLVVSRMLGQALNAHSARAAVVQDAGNLPRLPDGWTWSRLGQLADVVGGITKDGSKQSAVDLVEVPYLRVANVQRGRLDLSVVKSIRVSAVKAEALRLMPGDVLMNEGGDRDKLGRGWVWSGEIDDCIHQNHVFRARPHGGVIRSALLSWWANTVGGEWCERHGRQSVNLASISLRRIREMPVPIPPRAVQESLEREIAEALVGASRLAADVAAATTRASGLRRAILAAGLAGALR